MTEDSEIPHHAFSIHRPSQMDRDEFVAVFSTVFEYSSWIAISAWNQGLTTYDDTAAGLCRSLIDIVETAGREPQLALLRAHPDLAGRLARRGEVTDASRGEQAGAGLDQCNEDEYQEFQDLNQRYVEKFGFPFILAVRGRHRSEILEVFRGRVENDLAEEFSEALRQTYRIALLRLGEIS